MNKSPISWAEFLVEYPPGSETLIDKIARQEEPSVAFDLPDVTLYCPNDPCRTEMQHRPQQRHESIDGNTFLTYKCERCGGSKQYAVHVFVKSSQLPLAQVRKFGEWPAFSMRVPTRLISIVGPAAELFAKGRRAESAGLGVGAFAYYRQLVEDHKSRFVQR